MLADTLSCHEQDIGHQEALGKAHCTQVLLTPNKLDPEINCQLAQEITPINNSELPLVQTNGHAPLNLINQILTANK